MNTEYAGANLPLADACAQLASEQSTQIRYWLWMRFKSTGGLRRIVELLQQDHPAITAMSPEVREAVAAMIYSPMPLDAVSQEILEYCVFRANQELKVRTVSEFFASLIAEEYTSLNEAKAELLLLSGDSAEYEQVQDRIDDRQTMLDELARVVREQFPGLSLDHNFQSEVRARTPNDAELFLQRAELRRPNQRRGGPEGDNWQ